MNRIDENLICIFDFEHFLLLKNKIQAKNKEVEENVKTFFFQSK